MIATRIATASEISAATCALSLMPPSRMNSARIGRIAKMVLANSESPTGSNTCLYMRAPPPVASPRAYPASLDLQRARRPLHHLLQRHAVPRHGEGGRHAPRAARLRGRRPARADLLRSDALQLGLRGRRARAGPALRARLRSLRRHRVAVRVVHRDGPRPLPGAVRAGPRADRVPGRPARGDRWGRDVPAPRDPAPALPLAAGAADRRPPAPAAR